MRGSDKIVFFSLRRSRWFSLLFCYIIMSLVEELSQKASSKISKKHLIIAAGVIVIGGGGWYRYSAATPATTDTPTSTEYVVKK